MNREELAEYLKTAYDEVRRKRGHKEVTLFFSFALPSMNGKYLACP
jgi:hypothetical protein